ncbi:RNA polymerase factor sigma-54 [Aquamicrobium sp. LC103]|uniref:RNA polymerase factor sigma-54 n=1 Tax=Aquamicrobium sp. LC103 TaxID=1120658 RepID=UPI00063E71FD|nr:RNA polymerase factor sigma-54 [Aquamicrobium sp. LC103]TKT82639.1 RNA polymerase factor sigma-54 [Aquamicrobium sp. LC103]
MALGAKLQLRQSQSLVMTPQLMQSIRLLQLTHVELDRFVEEEIERNPLLERAEARDDEPAVDESPSSELRETSGIDQWFDDTAAANAQTMSERLDTSLENVFPDDPGIGETLSPDLALNWKSAATSGGTGAGEGFDVGEMAGGGPTLRDHVGEQIALAFRDPTSRIIAAELADALDEAGYLRADPVEIAERLGTGVEAVLDVLSICQSADPAGLFARDLAECLALQLKARDRFDPAMQAMVANLELLAKRDFAQLRKLCGVDEEDLVDMMAEIRALDPRPGLAFGGGTADPVVPDVIVRQAADGSWAIELNADALPRVLVDQTYFAVVSRRVRNQREKEFLAECLQNANWLTRSLDQRAKTILKVASEIVRQQDAFLLHGIRHLRPLNLRTVAEAIGMHESTVSRVTANKYMMTPRGVFELRYFFSVAIASAEGGDAHSSEAVRDRIRELIEAEKPADVLSDDAIVEILKKSGVDIARRTVAKYREGMSIPSSVQRRREKRVLASVRA